MLGIGLFAIISVVFATQLKNIKSEFSILVIIVACIIIFFNSISMILEAINLLKNIMNKTSLSNYYIDILLKIIGITYIAEFVSDISKDCGFSSIGNQIHILCKIMILSISVPIFENLFNIIGGMLE